MTLEEYVENKHSENELVEKVVIKIVTCMQMPQFGIGGVPTRVAAKVMGKSESYVRRGIEQG